MALARHLLHLVLAQVDEAYAAHLNALLVRGPESRAKLAEVAVMLEDCGLLGTLDTGERTTHCVHRRSSPSAVPSKAKQYQAKQA